MLTGSMNVRFVVPQVTKTTTVFKKETNSSHSHSGFTKGCLCIFGKEMCLPEAERETK